MFLSHVHNFRALAIIFIVAGHSLFVFDWAENPYTLHLLQDIFQNGTVLFVFIAGYLFLHLAGNFSYRTYLGKKLAYVILPYILVSIPAIFYAYYGQDLAGAYPELAEHGMAWGIAWLYLKGGAHINYALWFIPMIAVFYLCAPAFIAVRDNPRAYWLILPLFGFSLLLHRSPFPNLDLWQSFVYFLPIYLLGMFACQYRERVDALVARYLWPLGLVILVVFVLQSLVLSHHGAYTARFVFDFSEGIFDWLLLQKTLFCFFLLGILRHYDRLVPSWLEPLAATSFTIFFLHVYFLFLFTVLVGWRQPAGEFSIWSLVAGASLLGSFASAWLARRLLPAHSRLLVGS